MVLELSMFGIARKLSVFSTFFNLRNSLINVFIAQELLKSQMTIFWLQGIFRINS